MRFTRENTYEEILNFPEMKAYMKVLFSDFILDLFPKDMRNLSLGEAEKKAKTPWGEPFWVITDQLLSAANTILDITINQERRCLPLWKPKGTDWKPETDRPGEKESVFLLSPVKAYDTERPVVIICPGGGYEDVCFGNEGHPIMEFMEKSGYGVFVLRYRVRPNSYPEPQKDLLLAIKYVRSHAKEFHINPNQLLIMGSSAGGHLCASVGALYKEIEEVLDCGAEYKKISGKPNYICLNYPVISFVEEPHESSFLSLTGGDQELRERLSVEGLVTPDYPKTFVWACADDDLVPASNARNMMEALEKNGVIWDGVIYESGGHGCGLALTKEAKGWSKRMLEFMK